MDVENVFRTHHDALFRYLARTCGDPHLAKDAVQETFVRLQRQSVVQPAAIRSWLFTTGMNVIRDVRRQEATHARILETNPRWVPTPTSSEDPAERVERSEDRARLARALEELRERERRALLMREEGFKHREIAEALDTTTGSVGTLLARALEKLARAMGPLEEAP